MVHNPIYEGGVIYEEIPDVKNFRSVSSKQTDCTEHGEEGYVSIGNRTTRRELELDFPSLEKCDIVSTKHGGRALGISPALGIDV